MTKIAAHIGEDTAAQLAALAQSLGTGPERVSAAGEPRQAATPVRWVECRTCRGRYPRGGPGGDSGRPWGWYHISVAVPAELGKAGKPYVWAGVYCSVRCLSVAIPQLAEAEKLAHQSYRADRPQQPAPPAGLAALMQERPPGRPA